MNEMFLCDSSMAQVFDHRPKARQKWERFLDEKKRFTGRTCFVRADIHDNQERLLAIGQATFRIIQKALTP